MRPGTLRFRLQECLFRHLDACFCDDGDGQILPLCWSCRWRLVAWRLLKALAP